MKRLLTQSGLLRNALLGLIATLVTSVFRETSPAARAEAAPRRDTRIASSAPARMPRSGNDLQHFAVRLNGIASPHRIQSAFVLPGEHLRVEVDTPDGREFTLIGATGHLERVAPNKWTWQVPAAPGLYPAHIIAPASDSTLLNVFVMVPYERVRDGCLNGYCIGTYPDVAQDGDPLYNPPAGFVEVTRQNQNALLTPHFRLGQFVCKAPSSGPRYVVLQEKLVMQLESMVETLNAAGIATRTLHVMSGYRTPAYNRGLGNVRLSMHQFGAAADVFVDRDGDNTMDDLNHDGRIDRADAQFLFDLVERRTPGAPYPGGLATYGATSAHGPFVHLDVRGRTARWDS